MIFFTIKPVLALVRLCISISLIYQLKDFALAAKRSNWVCIEFSYAWKCAVRYAEASPLLVSHSRQKELKMSFCNVLFLLLTVKHPVPLYIVCWFNVLLVWEHLLFSIEKQIAPWLASAPGAIHKRNSHFWSPLTYYIPLVFWGCNIWDRQFKKKKMQP